MDLRTRMPSNLILFLNPNIVDRLQKIVNQLAACPTWKDSDENIEQLLKEDLKSLDAYSDDEINQDVNYIITRGHVADTVALDTFVLCLISTYSKVMQLLWSRKLGERGDKVQSPAGIAERMADGDSTKSRIILEFIRDKRLEVACGVVCEQFLQNFFRS